MRRQLWLLLWVFRVTHTGPCRNCRQAHCLCAEQGQLIANLAFRVMSLFDGFAVACGAAVATMAAAMAAKEANYKAKEEQLEDQYRDTVTDMVK